MSTINVSELGVIARSKIMYRLLTIETKIYITPQKECSIYFIREIYSTAKRKNFPIIY